jgi:hypothetical protein
MDVAKVMILSRVASSNRGLSSRYAAVKAPEVMTLISAPFTALAPSSAPASKIPMALQATGIILVVELVFRFATNAAIAYPLESHHYMRNLAGPFVVQT